MSQTLLIAFLVATFLTACGTSPDEYLDREQFDLSVNGTVMATTKPLAPYEHYRAKISSPHNLRVFLGVIEHWLWPDEFYWQFHFTGAELLAIDSQNGPHGLLNDVTAEFQGTGQPLRIGTSKDFTAAFDAPTLSVVIAQSRWWRKDDGTGVNPDLFFLAIPLLIVVVIICGLVSERRARPAPALPAPRLAKPLATPQREPVPIPVRMLPAPPHAQRFTLKPHTPCTSPEPLPHGSWFIVTIEGLWRVSERGVEDSVHPDPTLYGIDAAYVGPCAKPVGAWQHHHMLFFDDATEPATSFHHDRHHHRYSFAYTGIGDKLVLFLEVPPVCAGHTFWHHDTMSVMVREMSPAERAEYKAPPAVPVRNLEEEQRQSYLDRLRPLKVEYSGRRHLDDAQWLEQYTTTHLHDLLNDRTRITKEHRDLHADPDFVRLFMETEPELYARVTWEYRALCRAEELEPGNPTKRPKLSPEERQAKFERYRQRALERDRIQAEDRMAAVRQKLNLIQQFRDDLEAYDLDEDERDRHIKELEDDLFAQNEENADGFKKL